MDNTASNERAIIAVAAVAVLLVFGGIWYVVWQNSRDVPPDEARIVEERASGLIIEDVTPGTGREAQPGMVVSVHYVGTLPDGTKFDASRDRGEPFVFTLGSGMVIEGWERGIPGMRVGGVRELTIPPELAYGEEGLGSAIPPNATLHFEVELLGVGSS